MIRCYHPADASVVSQLWLEGNLQAHFFVSPTHWHTYLPLLPEALAQAEVYVYDEGGVKGFIGVCDTYIAGLFVAANSRSKGIGKLLLDYLKDSHSVLDLSVYVRNLSALRFYQREGFAKLRSQIEEETGEEEWVMRWESQQVVCQVDKG